MAASMRCLAVRVGHERSAFKASFLSQNKFNFRFCVKPMSSQSQYCLELVR